MIGYWGTEIVCKIIYHNHSNNRRWPVQARLVATEFLLFIYLRATYMLAFLCRIPFNPYFTESYISHIYPTLYVT